MQFDVQEQYWMYIYERFYEYSQHYPSVMALLEKPNITALPGTPKPLLPPDLPPWYTHARQYLEGILHAVRKLREGLVASRRKDGLVSQGALALY